MDQPQPQAGPPATTRWIDYPASPTSTVVGTLKVSTGQFGPAGSESRRILVYLPASYTDSKRRYPVIYMHDGQNLFDEATSYAGEWQVDETMQALSAEGMEAIVVGIPNAGAMRAWDYSPHPHSEFGGGGADAYVDFLARTVKPLIDGTFRTVPERSHTGIMGSSLGGVVSLYAFFARSETFGFAGVMSPAFWWTEGAIFHLVEQASFVPGSIYMDVGDNESPEVPGRPEEYLSGAIRMDELLRAKGYGPDNLYFMVDPGGQHNETAWARRLPEALRFLLWPFKRG